MAVTRRKALQLLAVGPATLAAAPTAAAPPATEGKPRYGMVIDLRRCIGCQACVVACGVENGIGAGQTRTTVALYELLDDSGPRRSPLPRTCNHCEDPPCVRVCPTQATYQRADGIVVVDNTVCVGCAYCAQACPYEARFINEDTRTADKCTFCVHRLEAGMLPACVETCVGGARVFGDLNDPGSAVATLLRDHETEVLKPWAETGPTVFYIGLDPRLQGRVSGTPAPHVELAGTEVSHG